MSVDNIRISDIIKQVLAHRQKTMSSKINEFLNPTYQQIQHTYKQFDFIDDVVSRIKKAVELNERITIHGDFDADGLTASAIITEYFKSINYINFDVFIPDRLTSGHGLQNEVVERLAHQGTKLIITVDCGIEAVDQVKTAKGLEIDVIVTDHHLPGDELPDCLILSPPQSLATPYSGAGIAFKLVQALLEPNGFAENIKSKVLQLAMLGTVVDAVPQVGENRAISRLGLEQLSKAPFTSIDSMITHLELKDITSEDITFSIAPRLSAASRLGNARLAYDFLVTDDMMEAFDLQSQLTALNNKRKQLVKKTLDYVSVNAAKPTITTMVEKDARGITGIVASRLVDKYKKPAFVCAKRDDEYLQCSARSGGYCDLSDAFAFVRRVIESGGGHKHAGGALLLEENYPDFSMLLNTFMRKVNENQNENTHNEIDAVSLPLNLVGEQLVRELRKLEPYGPDGVPVFKSYVLVSNCRLIGKEKNHIDMKTKCNESGTEVRAIGWNMANLYYSIDRRNELDPLEIKYTISKNEFRGQTRYELHLVDVDFHGTEIPF